MERRFRTINLDRKERVNGIVNGGKEERGDYRTKNKVLQLGHRILRRVGEIVK